MTAVWQPHGMQPNFVSGYHNYIDSFQIIQQQETAMKKIWRWIKETINRLTGLWKFILMGLILVGAWLGFLYLAGDPPFDPIPALIMVWASVVALTIVGFPKFWGQIKRLKFKDFEIELQQSVAAASAREAFEIPVQAEPIVGEKANLSAARALIERAKLSPGKPVVLMVNVEMEAISISKLFLLLTAFEIIKHPAITLFVKTRQREVNLRNLKKEHVLGAISAERAAKILLMANPQADYEYLNAIHSARIDGYIDLLWKFWNHKTEHGENRNLDYPEWLSASFIQERFGNLLSTRFVDRESVIDKPEELQSAIRNEQEYILVLKENSLESIIQIELLTKEIALQALAQLSKNK